MEDHPRHGERGQVLVLLLILLAILGGGTWWLFHAKQQNEDAARAFAREAVRRLAFQHDRKFLNEHISPEARTRYPPSFRDRLVENLRTLGVPKDNFELDGDVTFTSRFFQPRGSFRVRLEYPGSPAYFDLGVSQPHGWWQFDYLNLTWHVEPPPAPSPAASPSVAP